MKSDIEALRQALAEHVRFHDDGLGCTADSEEWHAACNPRTIARLLDALELAQRELAAWHERCPAHRYRPQDDCISLKWTDAMKDAP